MSSSGPARSTPHLRHQLSAHEEKTPDPGSWPGLNLLAFALMDVRARLRATGVWAVDG